MTKQRDVNVRVGVDVDPRAAKQLNKVGKDTLRARKAAVGGLDKDKRAVRDLTSAELRMARSIASSAVSLRNIERHLRSGTQELKSHNRELDKTIKKQGMLRRSIQKTGKIAGNKATAIGGAVGGGLAGKQLVDDDAFWTRLSTDADVDRDRISLLKQQAFSASVDMRVDPDQVKMAIAEIQQRTGDLDLAQDNLMNIAIGLQGGGSTGQDLGGLISEMSQKLGLRSAQDVLAMLDTFKQQGDKGAFTLKNLASHGGRLLANMAGKGQVGEAGGRESMALLQMGMQGTGSKDLAVSSAESTLRDLIANKDEVEALGVDVFDPDSDGELMRSPSLIIKEVITATEGRTTDLMKVFGDESIRLVSAAVIDSKRGFKDYDTFLNVRGNGEKITEAAVINRATAASAFTYVSGLWSQFLDDAGSELVHAAAGVLDDTDDLQAKRTVGAVGFGAAGASGGAALGAAIGSVFPVVGTAIGAGIGALVGAGAGAGGAYVLADEGDEAADTKTDEEMLTEQVTQAALVSGPVMYTDNSQTVLHVTQQPGEDSERLAERVVELVDERERHSLPMRQRSLRDD